MSRTTLVVKLGGSLYDHVPELAEVFRKSPQPIFIVPGGGKFADVVRKMNLPDEDAHWEAIAAMDQFGRYIASFGLDTTDLLSIPAKTTVFLPYRCTRYHDPLPHSWNITSDTIAAWVACKLGLDLIVLKSVDGISIDGRLAGTISQPISTDVIDPCFIPFVLRHKIRTTIINGSVPETLTRFLQGGCIPCTRIGTTF